MGLGKGLRGFRLLCVAALVAVPTIASAHALLVNPVPRTTDSTNQSLKVAPCGATADGLTPKVKGMPVAQFDAGATIKLDYKETVDHRGCFIFQLSSTGDDKNFQNLKLTNGQNAQVADPLGGTGNHSTEVVLPAGVTCQNCTLRMLQVMLGADCPANQDPTNTSNYYSCADIRIGNFADAGAIMDAGPPDYDAATDIDPASDPDLPDSGASSSGNTSSSSSGNGATSGGSRNLRAGAGDDGCNVGFGTTGGLTLFAATGMAVMALLRRRKKD
jgi:hypothetical protein